MSLAADKIAVRDYLRFKRAKFVRARDHRHRLHRQRAGARRPAAALRAEDLGQQRPEPLRGRHAPDVARRAGGPARALEQPRLLAPCRRDALSRHRQALAGRGAGDAERKARRVQVLLHPRRAGLHSGDQRPCREVELQVRAFRPRLEAGQLSTGATTRRRPDTPCGPRCSTSSSTRRGGSRRTSCTCGSTSCSSAIGSVLRADLLGRAARNPFMPQVKNVELGRMLDLERAPEYLTRGQQIAAGLGWPSARQTAQRTAPEVRWSPSPTFGYPARGV